MIHHTLGEGLDHAIYQSVSKPLSAATEFLWEDGSFTQQVDRVIEASFKTKLPVYLYIPIDTPDILVDGSRLDKPLDLTISNPGRESEEQEVVDQIVSAIEKAEHPCFLVDLYTQRFGATKDLRDIVESTQIPVSHTIRPSVGWLLTMDNSRLSLLRSANLPSMKPAQTSVERTLGPSPTCLTSEKPSKAQTL